MRIILINLTRTFAETLTALGLFFLAAPSRQPDKANRAGSLLIQ
jgi:hypothetical protein